VQIGVLVQGEERNDPKSVGIPGKTADERTLESISERFGREITAGTLGSKPL
jgi:hypothetical protein